MAENVVHIWFPYSRIAARIWNEVRRSETQVSRMCDDLETELELLASAVIAEAYDMDLLTGNAIFQAFNR